MIGKKEFRATTLDLKDENFVGYVASLAIFDTSKIHSSHRAQIISFQVNDVLTTVHPEYSNSADISFLQ